MDLPRGVENGDLDAGTLLSISARERIETGSVASHVRFGPNLRIHGNLIRLTVRLNAEAAEKNSSRVGFDLAVETIERRAHRLFGEVLPDVDLESLSPQVIGQCAALLTVLLQRRIGVRIGRAWR